MPEAPTSLSNNAAVTDAGIISLTWIAAYNGGSQILDYTLSYYTGISQPTVITGINQVSYVITGLTNDTVYNI